MDEKPVVQTAGKTTSLNDEVDDEETMQNLESEFSKKAEISKKAKNNKKKKDRRKGAGSSYLMNLNLLWDDDHDHKINAICGFRTTSDDEQSHKLFVGDVSSDMTIYSLL